VKQTVEKFYVDPKSQQELLSAKCYAKQLACINMQKPTRHELLSEPIPADENVESWEACRISSVLFS
jgi:hypothetical protein